MGIAFRALPRYPRGTLMAPPAALRILIMAISRGLYILSLRALLGTTRQNVFLIEKRARNNLEKAEESLRVYRRLMTAATVELKSGTHLVDVRGYSLTPLKKPVKR